MDRKRFIRNALGCAVGCVALRAGSGFVQADGEPADPTTACDAAPLRDWLSGFIRREEGQIDRAALVKLLQERGRACCRGLDFRQKLIRESNGDVDKLVGLLGNIVGPENATREGRQVVLVYPVQACGCGWSPQRAPTPDDPYCECSKANNQLLFETVTGQPVKVELTESPRRGGTRCRFVIGLS